MLPVRTSRTFRGEKSCSSGRMYPWPILQLVFCIFYPRRTRSAVASKVHVGFVAFSHFLRFLLLLAIPWSGTLLYLFRTLFRVPLRKVNSSFSRGTRPVPPRPVLPGYLHRQFLESNSFRFFKSLFTNICALISRLAFGWRIQIIDRHLCKLRFAILPNICPTNINSTFFTSAATLLVHGVRCRQHSHLDCTRDL